MSLFVKFNFDLLKNLFYKFASMLTEDHAILMSIIPIKDLIQVANLPAKRPPIADHLDRKSTRLNSSHP